MISLLPSFLTETIDDQNFHTYQSVHTSPDVLVYHHGIEDVCCASVDADRQEPNIGLAIGAVAEAGGTWGKRYSQKDQVGGWVK